MGKVDQVLDYIGRLDLSLEEKTRVIQKLTGYVNYQIVRQFDLQRNFNRLLKKEIEDDLAWREIHALDGMMVSTMEIIDYEAVQIPPNWGALPALDSRMVHIARQLDLELAKTGNGSLEAFAPQRLAQMEKRRNGIRRAISPKDSPEYDAGDSLRQSAIESDIAWRDLHIGLLQAKKERDKAHGNRNMPYRMADDRRLMAELIISAQKEYGADRPKAAKWVIHDLQQKKQRGEIKPKSPEDMILTTLKRWQQKGSDKLSNELYQLHEDYKKEQSQSDLSPMS